MSPSSPGIWPGHLVITSTNSSWLTSWQRSSTGILYETRNPPPVNSPSRLCFSQHVVARLDSSWYLSASWSLPLQRRGRRARLSSAKLRLEVSSISLSTWRSWNWTKKKSQSQQMSHSELMPSETHKYAEAISTQLRCLWRHRLCCLYGCSLLGFWQTNIGWLMWNAVCQRGTFATDPRSRNSGTLYNTERFIWSWISIVWPRLANSTRQSFRCKHLQ